MSKVSGDYIEIVTIIKSLSIGNRGMKCRIFIIPYA